MVKEIIRDNKKYFQCKICKLIYENKNMAEKCQKWCEKYKSCNLAITKSAVKK